jgi:hypothetical protein
MPHLFLAQSIISNFDMAIKCQQNIIQLQVPVVFFVRKPQEWKGMETKGPIYNSVRMEVFKSKEDFRSIEFGLSQRKLFALDVKHQITSTDILHDKVYTSLRLET